MIARPDNEHNDPGDIGPLLGTLLSLGVMYGIFMLFLTIAYAYRVLTT